jgi:hypothetical protein
VNDEMSKAVIAGLKAAINDHGPITREFITSAAKRIVGRLRGTDQPSDAPLTPYGEALALLRDMRSYVGGLAGVDGEPFTDRIDDLLGAADQQPTSQPEAVQPLGPCPNCGASEDECSRPLGPCCDRCDHAAADQQSAREGLDELTRMAQEDGLYDMPEDKT